MGKKETDTRFPPSKPHRPTTEVSKLREKNVKGVSEKEKGGLTDINAESIPKRPRDDYPGLRGSNQRKKKGKKKRNGSRRILFTDLLL